MILLLAPVVADGVIELNDGRRVAVPVDKSEVGRTGFTPSTAEQGLKILSRRSSRSANVSRGFEPGIWRVGAGRVLKYPSDAAKRAKDGDIVEIEAGTYHNDYTIWNQNDLTIRGIGGMAHLKSKGLIPNGKAIWILNGGKIVIENIEFSGAAVKGTNGAGIRHQGGDLRLRNTFFHDNEFSILSGKLPKSNIEVVSSRFWFQKRPNRFSHGIYIGKARSFTLIGCHFKGTDQGHHVKSRAFENYIFYNRIEDVSGGNSSRLVDLSNCGLSFIVGNDLLQAATSENFNAIGYGPEGCEQRNDQQMKLFVINNTFVNEAKVGSFVWNYAGGDVVVSNNLVFGAGDLLVGDGIVSNNVQMPLRGRDGRTWNAPSGSAAVDRAANLPEAEGVSLIPTMEFTLPAGTRDRPINGPLDVGSREK